MMHEVTIKLKHRLFKGEGWHEQSSMRFVSLPKAEEYKSRKQQELAKYDGQVEITDNYSDEKI